MLPILPDIRNSVFVSDVCIFDSLVGHVFAFSTDGPDRRVSIDSCLKRASVTSSEYKQLLLLNGQTI